MATFHDLTTAQLKEALQIREQMEKLQQKLDSLRGGTAPETQSGVPVAKRTRAVAGRRKIDAAPAGRWAHVRSPLDTLMDAAPEQAGGLTAEGGAKASAARKKRASAPNATAI